MGNESVVAKKDSEKIFKPKTDREQMQSIPILKKSEISSQRAETLCERTTTDNANNTGEKVADNDMDFCIYNDDPLHPIEFFITVNSIPSNPTLTIYAFDVDQTEGEVDKVYINGNYLGTLTGSNNQWSSTTFYVNPSFLVTGDNLVRIDVDVDNPAPPEVWCVNVDYGEICNATPIIFLPGVMGSELYNDFNDNDKMDEGELVWLDIKSQCDQSDDIFLNVLKLKEDGTPLDPTTNIKVGDIVRKIELSKITFDTLFCNNVVKNLVGDIDIYDGLIKHLESIGYEENRDLFNFSYDWRKDIRLTATQLGQKVDNARTQTGSDKVIIVAHSMGTIVTRYYLNNTTNAQKVDKVIFLGGPHLGSTYAYLPFVGITDIKFLNGERIKEVVANFSGAYQLLPNQQYFNEYKWIFEDLWGEEEGKLRSPKETYIDNDDSRLPSPTLVDDAKNFWGEMGAWDKPGKISSNVEVFNVIGSGKWTWLGVEISGVWGRGGYYGPYYKVNRHTSGDETVQLKSAEGLTGSNVKHFYIKEKHQELPTNEKVQNLIDEILKGNKDPVIDAIQKEPFRGNWFTRFLGISPKSMEIHIYNSINNHTGPINYSVTNFIEFGIPNSSYWIANDTSIGLIEHDDTFTLTMNSTGSQSFLHFDLTEISGEESVIRKLYYLNITIGPNTTGLMSYEPNSTDLPNLLIDYEGDGVYEETISPLTTGNLAGKVIDLDGNPIPNAIIIVTGPLFASDFTNTTGDYSINFELVSGTYNITAKASGFTEESDLVDIIGGETTIKNFVLKIACVPTPSSPIVNQTSPACASGKAYYSQISQAVTDANDGDTVVVCPGSYSDYIRIKKPLIVCSPSGPSDTIINSIGNNIFEIVGTNASYVNISGFTITGAEEEKAGISGGPNSHIFNNIITKNYYGVIGGRNATIRNNTFSQNGERVIYGSGIRLGLDSRLFNNVFDNNTIAIGIWGIRNTLRSNSIFKTLSQRGLRSRFYNDIDESNTINSLPIKFYDGWYQPCPDNTVLNFNNTYSQIFFAYCNNVTLEYTTATDSIIFEYTNNSRIQHSNASYSYDGIILDDSFNNTIINNTLYNNSYGIDSYWSQNNDIVANDIAYCSRGIGSYATNKIIDNKISYSLTGIYFENDTTIINNTIISALPPYPWIETFGIVSDPASMDDEIYGYSSIINNTIINSTAGIYILGESGGTTSGFYTISGNTVNFNDFGIVIGRNIIYGILEGSYRKNITIANNEINNNSIGIDLAVSNYATLSNNTINWNDVGISLRRSNSSFASKNEVCYNGLLDFNLTNSFDNIGKDNRCDKPDGWNDVGSVGCSLGCIDGPPLMVWGLDKIITNRGKNITAFAKWDVNIKNASIETNISDTLLNYTISPPYSGNWTNATLTAPLNGILGIKQVRIYVEDPERNGPSARAFEVSKVGEKAAAFDSNTWYSTSIKYFYVYGYSNSLTHLSSSSIYQGSSVTVSCRIKDVNTSSSIPGYYTEIYADNTKLSYGYTDGNGLFEYKWTTSSTGTHTIKCAIYNNPDKYYHAVYNDTKSLTVISGGAGGGGGGGGGGPPYQRSTFR